jgi:hypothetical protein
VTSTLSKLSPDTFQPAPSRSMRVTGASNFTLAPDARTRSTSRSYVVSPPAQFLTDVQNGQLASMTWITPTLATSDHPVSETNLGPAWVTSVVDAVGNSRYWDSTALFIMWDDWGGWYDHVPPPTVSAFGLGLRVSLRSGRRVRFHSPAANVLEFRNPSLAARSTRCGLEFAPAARRTARPRLTSVAPPIDTQTRPRIGAERFETGRETRAGFTLLDRRTIAEPRHE